ncbi:DNA sulfur modification protein DndB [Nitrospirales bacterium NOB]|nr:DNA sulfur modification protein DndB [Nitrospirales bacterium NOB]
MRSVTDSGFVHAFPAVKGVQAGRTFYIAMCPLGVVPKIFMFDEAEVPPELRAQRTLNRARVPAIARYLLNNIDNYVLSALTASVDAKITFVPSAESGPMSSLGVMNIPMTSRILINDGQHRRAAIEEAIKHNQLLGHDNVPVLFFVDEGLTRSQQMFADLNKHAVRPSTSLGTLYDQRDESARLARNLAVTCKPFLGMTEMEKSSISNRSTKLFALASIRLASRALLKLGKGMAVSEQQEATAKSYWEEVAKNIPDWERARNGEVTTANLREQTVHAHSLALQALANVGTQLLADYPTAWKRKLTGLKSIDWSRSNTRLWEGRALTQGRLSKSAVTVAATTAVLKQHLELSLSSQESALLDRSRKKKTRAK